MTTQLLQDQHYSDTVEILEHRLDEIEQAIVLMRQSQNHSAADMIKTYAKKARIVRNRIRQLRGEP